MRPSAPVSIAGVRRLPASLSDVGNGYHAYVARTLGQTSGRGSTSIFRKCIFSKMHFSKMHFSKFLQIFGGLVPGCIKTTFCKNMRLTTFFKLLRESALPLQCVYLFKRYITFSDTERSRFIASLSSWMGPSCRNRFLKVHLASFLDDVVSGPLWEEDIQRQLLESLVKCSSQKVLFLLILESLVKCSS